MVLSDQTEILLRTTHLPVCNLNCIALYSLPSLHSLSEENQTLENTKQFNCTINYISRLITTLHQTPFKNNKSEHYYLFKGGFIVGKVY